MSQVEIKFADLKDSAKRRIGEELGLTSEELKSLEDIVLTAFEVKEDSES